MTSTDRVCKKKWKSSFATKSNPNTENHIAFAAKNFTIL